MRTATTILLALLLCAGARPGLAQIGNPAPDFTAVDTHGDTIRLYDLLDSGKVVILDFFFTTCIPCQYYTPQVNLAYKKYGCNEHQVVFIAIDYEDTNAEVIAYDNTYNIKYPSVSGTQGGGNGIVSLYGVFGFPTFYMIDSTRKIIDKIDPPTLQVFDFRFAQHGIQPVACSTGTDDPAGQPALLTVWPNPVTGETLRLQLAGISTGNTDVSVFDFSGRLVFSERQNGETAELPVGKLLAGLYSLRVSSPEGRTLGVGTFVKQ